MAEMVKCDDGKMRTAKAWRDILRKRAARKKEKEPVKKSAVRLACISFGDVLKRIDAKAKKAKLSRSAWVRKTCEAAL